MLVWRDAARAERIYAKAYAMGVRDANTVVAFGTLRVRLGFCYLFAPGQPLAAGFVRETVEDFDVEAAFRFLECAGVVHHTWPEPAVGPPSEPDVDWVRAERRLKDGCHLIRLAIRDDEDARHLKDYEDALPDPGRLPDRSHAEFVYSAGVHMSKVMADFRELADDFRFEPRASPEASRLVDALGEMGMQL